MTITARQVNDNGIRVFMGTLTEEVDLHAALTAVATHHAIHTATFQLLGGLHDVIFTAYDFARGRRSPPQQFSGSLEIIAGHGTISQWQGTPHIHMHMTVSFPDSSLPHGTAVVGGHVQQARPFAIEFTITAYDGQPVHRALDTTTQLNLWDLPPIPAPVTG